jgi:molybdate transport system ATP-binding protein
LEFFGLAKLETRTLRELSYGQLRRVLFARAWVNHPELLLLDEPFAGIDAPTRRFLLEHVDQLLASGTTVMIATHHREEWPHRATHELELRNGRAVYCGVVRSQGIA